MTEEELYDLIILMRAVVDDMTPSTSADGGLTDTIRVSRLTDVFIETHIKQDND